MQCVVIFVGSSGVGKTNIISRINKKSFAMNSKPTVGVEFVVRSVILEEGKLISVQIWDTAGQERYRSISSMYYRGSVGAIIVFDLTDIESFNNLDIWFNQVRNNTDDGISIVLIGNKCDIKNRSVTREMVEKYCEEKSIKYYETSALNDFGIESMFLEFINQIDHRILESKNNEKNQAVSINQEMGSAGKCCYQ